jgi:hypothetical protein
MSSSVMSFPSLGLNQKLVTAGVPSLMSPHKLDNMGSVRIT